MKKYRDSLLELFQYAIGWDTGTVLHYHNTGEETDRMCLVVDALIALGGG